MLTKMAEPFTKALDIVESEKTAILGKIVLRPCQAHPKLPSRVRKCTCGAPRVCLVSLPSRSNVSFSLVCN